MEPLVLVCGGCGAKLRTSRPLEARARSCPRCGTPLDRATPLSPAAPAPRPAEPRFEPEPQALDAAPAPAVPPRLLLQAALLMLLSTGALIAMARVRVDQFASPSPTGTNSLRPAPDPALVAAPVVETRPAPCGRREPFATVPAAEAPAPPTSRLEFAFRSFDDRPNDPVASIAELTDSPERAGGSSRSTPPSEPRDLTPVTVPAESFAEVRHVRVADETGRVMVARVYGPAEQGWVLLPDGRLAQTPRLIPTNEPFVPLSPQELRAQLLDGELADFSCKRSDHYLIFYQCSPEFAERSAHLLDSLYEGLIERFRDQHRFEVHEAEFPLVAVIYADEADFRARRRVEPDIQAYYEIVSNRIFFYERKGDGRDADSLTAMEANRVAALRQPQTVAHEGTHQILQNIGVQPRLADWPLWLVEGLAELAAAPRTRKDGGWAGFSAVDPTHMATLLDLNLLTLRGRRPTRSRPSHVPDPPTFREILTRDDLSPTDYALAWGLTHYLANAHTEAFVGFLKAMSRMEPIVERTPDDRLTEFERAFGPLLEDFEDRVRSYLSKLDFDPPTYYAVTFQQDLRNGLVRRSILVSPSPPVIRQWLAQEANPRGGPWTWQAFPFDRIDAASHLAEFWLREGR